ncbi:hypothetical protein COY93_04165 [Candidatus Uhrbacteria bacterium CG_4_10_14_0_8_um_filter_58_22]|uniref:Type 4 fimbrial biogenesis protein PilX N-terminal domain-containing protein n=1 Tax=Candidatus Uhrbacteria bacterium CG_4_10_14_0_8_um_filter_58_22 TaxID=1975029 RepID=A0A2M7QA24_9BACT|nr:MAG: hypothetical protein AUJ19_04795 [Parcubacteria group bacterium CG1_02_58_44]PIY62034.1 MAG: hypothetical protein COY93_04165 [Candidatus Uhrbacteria bacterium CG_4_10_14_0_8_um_filter_58_22]
MKNPTGGYPNDGLHPRNGFVLPFIMIITALVVVAGLSLLSYASSVSRTKKLVREEFMALQSAEAGLSKAIFCLNAQNSDGCGGSFGLAYVGESDVIMGTGSFTTEITGAGSQRTVTSVGTMPSGLSRTVRIELTTIPSQDDVSFGYALQSGDGGAYLENNSEINGTLYSGGDVTCQTDRAVVDGDVYVSADGGKIDSCTVNYHAHADRILDSKVGGDAFFRFNPADIAGTDVDGTKFPGSIRPNPEPLPEIDLDFWHASAEQGGVVAGPFSPPDNSTIGPIKIVGDLNIGNGVDLTVTGPVWVTGNIFTGNVSSFTLAAGFGEYSTVILADDPSDQVSHGKIDVTNNTTIRGSGNPKSHLLFVSTNTSTSVDSPALSVANNSDGAIFFATQGALRIQNNAGAKSLAAYRLHVSQRATVNYVESDLADTKFSNSPGGVWHMVEDSWRQVR